MRLIDAINNVIIPEDAGVAWRYDAPIEAICEALNLLSSMAYDSAAKDLKAYPIYNWMCTDEHVGLDALYLHNEPVGCSYRASRKGSYQIEWISEEHAKATREYIVSTCGSERVVVLDPNQDIGDDFYVNHATAALTNEGFYQGRPVRMLVIYETGMTTLPQHRRPDHPYRVSVAYGDPRYNGILVQDGDERRFITMKEFRLPFNVGEVK